MAPHCATSVCAFMRREYASTSVCERWAPAGGCSLIIVRGAAGYQLQVICCRLQQIIQASGTKPKLTAARESSAFPALSRRGYPTLEPTAGTAHGPCGVGSMVYTCINALLSVPTVMFVCVCQRQGAVSVKDEERHQSRTRSSISQGRGAASVKDEERHQSRTRSARRCAPISHKDKEHRVLGRHVSTNGRHDAARAAAYPGRAVPQDAKRGPPRRGARARPPGQPGHHGDAAPHPHLPAGVPAPPPRPLTLCVCHARRVRLMRGAMRGACA
jgi:hypothetical protein